MSVQVDLKRLLMEVLQTSAAKRFADDRFVGYHDAAKGVQWHIAQGVDGDEVRLAINLEGLKYGSERPIKRFLSSEQSQTRVLAILKAVANPSDVAVHLTRDA